MERELEAHHYPIDFKSSTLKEIDAYLHIQQTEQHYHSLGIVSGQLISLKPFSFRLTRDLNENLRSISKYQLLYQQVVISQQKSPANRMSHMSWKQKRSNAGHCVTLILMIKQREPECDKVTEPCGDGDM